MKRRRKIKRNPLGSVRKKSWKLGEYAIGGIIEARVMYGGDAVVIRNTDQQTGEMIDQKIFRWPLDKFRAEQYLNELTTSYYASKIIDWIVGAVEINRMEYERPDAPHRKEGYIKKNPAPLFKSGGYIVVKTYTDGRQEFTDHIDTLKQAREFQKYFLKENDKMRLYRGRSMFSSVEILPHTAILKNPPLSSHGSNIKTKRTHGLSLAEMRALYKLVKQGNSEADKYARKKLEVPYSENKVQLLAVIDHHIRDLAG